MKGRAAEPSTKAEEAGEGTRPKGSEQEPEETAENEPRKRTERGKEVGSRNGRPEETKVGKVGRNEGSQGNEAESGTAEWKPL